MPALTALLACAPLHVDRHLLPLKGANFRDHFQEHAVLLRIPGALLRPLSWWGLDFFLCIDIKDDKYIHLRAKEEFRAKRVIKGEKSNSFKTLVLGVIMNWPRFDYLPVLCLQKIFGW